MKKLIILGCVSLLGFSMIAHAADTDINVTVKQERVKKLRAQAEQSHKKADALNAQADRLESGMTAEPAEKMRGIGGRPEKRLGGGGCAGDGPVSCGLSRK